jgi:DNA-binding FadR family transcriptional regulator
MARVHLQPYHRQAAIVSRMHLVCFRAMGSAYKRKGSFAARFKDFFITMVILANDDHDGHRPVSQSKIAKATGLSRPTVRERTKALERYGIIMKSGRSGGYVSNPDYFNGVAARVHARMRKAILAAATEMMKIK